MKAHFTTTGMNLLKYGTIFMSSMLLFAPALKAKDAHNGKLAIQLYQLCTACHGPQGHGNRELMAPAIAGLPEWYLINQLRKFKTGARGAHPADISGLRMRPMARTLDSGVNTERNSKEIDLHTIAHHVSQLPPKPQGKLTSGEFKGDPVNGQKIYAQAGTGCVQCHSDTARAKLPKSLWKAPPQENLEDWYMLEQLKKFKYRIRGGLSPKDKDGNPRDIDGMQMYGPVLVLKDEQAMKDVIAYIREKATKGTLDNDPAPTTTPTSSSAQPQ